MRRGIWTAAEREYLDRLQHYCRLRRIYVKDTRGARRSRREIQQDESKRVLAAVPRDRALFVLDRRGKQYSSEAFAELLQTMSNQGARALAFAIGGPLGFSDELLRAADVRLSLSEMTFPHELACVLFLEQLYRAMTILRGEKYHNP